MPYHDSRRSRERERRLRAKYRKKTAVTSIITLVLGLIVGFALCVVSVSHPGMARNLLKIGSVSDTVSTGDVDRSAVRANISDAVDSEDGSFEDFVAANLDAIEAFAAEDGTLTYNEELDEFGDFGTGPMEDDESVPGAETGDPDLSNGSDGETYSIESELQIVAAEVTPAPVVQVPEKVEEPNVALVEPATEAEEPVEEPVVKATPEPEPTEEPTPEVTAEPTPVPTAEPTPEPTAEPTPEATPESTPEPVIVPYGQPYTIQTQIDADGNERSEVNNDPYETLNLTLKVDAYKDPAYFQENYATQYKLQGDEAAVEFDLTLNGYTGAAEIIPQNFLLITFIGEDPSVAAQGYQLMDAEIAGKTDIAVTSDVPSKLYKRYPYSAEQGNMVYMVVTAYNDGVPTPYWFEILKPEPEATPEPAIDEAEEEGISLTVGSRGDDVVKLQQALINLGLLQGVPDGKFGNYTAEAVKTMQGRYGMKATGVADQEFLDRLYAANG